MSHRVGDIAPYKSLTNGWCGVLLTSRLPSQDGFCSERVTDYHRTKAACMKAITAYKRTKRNPVSRNPAGCLLNIGALTNLEVLDQKTGKTRNIRFRDRWLAWDHRGRRFHICRVVRKSADQIDGDTVARHRKFHSAAPSPGAFVADVPDATGPLRDVGLLKSLVYVVPERIKSPEKNPYQWHHAFGDTGHKGGDHYPESVMPALKVDRAGNYFIIRRPGNIFKVDTWLRG